MTYQINHDKLKKLIKIFFKNKQAFFTFGRIGIGKSQVYCETGKELSQEFKREFIDYNRVSKEKKQELIDNPEPYFAFIDLRLSEMDTTDIKGLISFADTLKKYIEWKMPMFAEIMVNPKSMGMLFLDEINLSSPLVMSSAYKVVYDRIIGEYAINGNWGIFGAGNVSEDRCYTTDVAPALLDRGGVCELQVPDVKSWTEWAIKSDIDSRVIGFINFKPSNLFDVNFDSNQKPTTPRGIARVGQMIKGTSNEDLKDIVCCNIGEGIGTEFVAWCKISEQIDLNGMIKNPERLKEVKEINIKWFILTAVAEQYKEKKIKFEKVIDVSRVMDKMDDVELVAYLWKMCSGMSKDFKKDFVEKMKSDDALIDKYSIFLC